MASARNLEDLLQGSKHLEFQLHCGSLTVVSIPSVPCHDSLTSYQESTEHKALAFFSGMEQTAFVRELSSRVDLQQIETVKFWIGIVEPTDHTSVNDILGALSAPAPPPKRNGSRERGVNLNCQWWTQRF